MNALTVISSFLSGLLGAMGFGGGSVLIIYLSLFLNMPQKEAQGINLFFFLIVNAFAVLSHFKNKLVDFKGSLSFLPVSILGLIIGYILLNYLEGAYLSKIFGVMLIILGIKELLGSFGKKLNKPKK